jgi:hypothetical protein
VALALVTGAAILAHAGIVAPTAPETTLAGEIAGDINAAITTYLDWPDGTGEDRYGDPIPARAATADELAELVIIARFAAAEDWSRRAAPFGVTGYSDATGAAIRVARDPLEAVRPRLERYRSLR